MIEAKAAVITTPPTDITAPIGTEIVFSVVAENVKAYRWQYSEDNGETWINLTAASAKTANYATRITATRIEKYIYRVKLTGEDDVDVFSDPVRMIEEKPQIIIDDVVYEINSANDGVIVVRFDNDTATTVIIPDTVEGLPVIQIGANAFEYKTALVSIDLPDSITIIGKRAFAGCTNLKEMK